MDRRFSSRDQPTSNMESTFPQPGQVPLYSPYLNFDQSYLKATSPEYLLPEGASSRRGRFEMAFAQIGSCLMASSTVGGVRGLITGLRETGDLSGAVRRSQLINYTVKGGGSLAHPVGSIAVMFSAFGVLLSQVRGTDDDINTVVSGGLTGMLFKSTSGLKRCGMGGAVGVGLAALYAFATSDSARKLL